MNCTTVPIVRYSGSFLKLIREEESRLMEKKSRKLMMIHKALHMRDDAYGL